MNLQEEGREGDRGMEEKLEEEEEGKMKKGRKER